MILALSMLPICRQGRLLCLTHVYHPSAGWIYWMDDDPCSSGADQVTSDQLPVQVDSVAVVASGYRIRS